VTFHGLFIGIDRYQDGRVPWLAGAARDAAALHALFADSLGDRSARLLTNEAATTGMIRDELQRLAAEASENDIVVVAYAGHGSEDHRIVTYDADVGRLVETCIGLDELADSVAAIPGRSLLCLLDCCFSGGFGARVLAVGLRPRNVSADPVAEALDRFTGVGRVAFTASAANEEAHESPRHGHGLMTYRLLEALQGVPEVVEGDSSTSLLRLIEYVTRTVQADAQQMGRQQTPTLRGQFDGAPLWPLLKPGRRYAELFPERTRPHATHDLASLAAYGFTPEVMHAWATSIAELNDLQLSAINDYGVLDGNNLVVTAPTSSGKTMIGELVALQAALQRRRSVFLLPMRALVNDKYDQFTRVYGPAGFRTIRATGEHSDDVPTLLRGQFDIALLTYETFSAMALGNPHILNLASTVVVDEAQTLTDWTRGSNLEFLLTMLNNQRGRTGSPQIITLSAVVGDMRGLERWLGGRRLHSDARPVPLVEGVLDHHGTYRFLDEESQEQAEPGFVQPLYDNGSRRLLIPLVRRLMDEGKKVVVFRQSKAEAVACAVYLSQALGLPPAEHALEQLGHGDISTSTQTLQRTLGGGVAFHNTDLDRDERHVVEQEFRDPASTVRVVVATPTLAMGINTPAAAVAIVGLTHPGRTPTPYTVAEYKNMVGRAGRLGLTERGESYLIPEGSLDPQRAWSGYVNGQVEDLVSRLVPDGDPRSLMLRVLASYPPDAVGLITEADVLSFLESSFAAFQAREGGSAQWNDAHLRRSFDQLVAASLIEADGSGYRLTALGRFTGESGVHVDSILRLVTGLRECAGSLNSVGLVAAAQLTTELDGVFLPVNARAVNTEVPRWPRVLAQQGVPHSLINSLQNTATDMAQAVARSKRASAAAMWIAGTPIETIELQLTQHLRQRGGVAGAVRAIADRTRDLLPAVAAVVRELAPDSAVGDLVGRTMLRLALGIPAEVVDLARLDGLQMTRAQWLSLNQSGLVTAEAIRDAVDDNLASILGSPAAAQSLKEAAEDDEPHTVEELVLPAPSE
jgi:replicative superfamily II helicase